MAKLLYTIIIPTHDRGELLKENLETLVPQVRKYQGEVSIFVSDNASKDNTEQIVKPFLESDGDIIQYHRHPKNIGYAANFIFATRQAPGKYACLMGDDDIMLPNHVETVVSLLKEHPDAGIVHFNLVTVGYDLKNGVLHDTNVRSLWPGIYPRQPRLPHRDDGDPPLLRGTRALRTCRAQPLHPERANHHPGMLCLRHRHHP